MSSVAERLNAALTDRYRIERELGAGGMATVYLAHDVRHDRRVALKVLKPELAAVVGADRFLTEITTTANLQHPHILPLFDSGEADGFVYYVMPYVEGESLRERLDREQQLPVEEAVDIAAKVANALDSAHEQGVVHRDIKPANILLAKGEPLIADFGIALAVQHAGGGRLTETGLSLGTPYYMSPEQATADRDPGPASDVYSLGCVLYEMLVGEPPFTGPSAQAVVAKLITADAPEVTEYRKTVPVHVAAVIRVALQKLPADRFGNAADFAEALRKPEMLATARLSRTGIGVGTATPSPAKRVLPGWVPWSAAVLGLAAALYFGMSTPSPDVRTAMRFSLGLPNADGVRAVTGGSGNVAVSPDGTQIVFLGTQAGRTRLFRRPLDGLAVEPLPGSEDALYPAFSPQGNEIAFATPDGVFRLLLDGGAPRRIATPPDAPLGITWVPDGTLLFGMLAFNADYRGLTEVSVDGDGELRTVTDPQAGMHHWAWALADGAHALFTDFAIPGVGLGLIDLETSTHAPLEVGGAPISGAILVVGIAGDVLLFQNRAGQIMAAPWDPDGLRVTGAPIPVPGIPDGVSIAAMAPDGTLAMTVGETAYQIAIVDADGAVERLVSADTVDLATVRFSSDGGRLLLGAALDGGDHEVWIVDLTSGVHSQLDMGVPETLAEWSASGSEVLAASWRQSDRDHGIWGRPADASAEPARRREGFLRTWVQEGVETTDYMEFVGLHAHADGESFAFTLNAGTNPVQPNWDIYIGRLGADTTLVPFAVGDADEVAARFSPDGRWLAYASNESGRFEVYVRPFPGPGPRVQVSSAGGGQPIWSRDGRRIFYRTDDALTVADVVVEGGALRVSGRRRLFQASLLAGGPDTELATYDVHPDGNRFVVLRAVNQRGGDVIVWTDWLDEIRPLLGRE